MVELGATRGISHLGEDLGAYLNTTNEVWDDGRSGASDRKVFGRRVSSVESVCDQAGIAITTATGIQAFPSVAWNGTHLLVAC